MKLINLKCEACGAQLKRTASLRTLECEYCGSRYLGEVSDNSLGFEIDTFLIPGEIEMEQSLRNLIQVMKSTQFVHEDAQGIIGQVNPRGVMVPCYTFECELTSNWQGENSVDKTRQVWNPVTNSYVYENYKEWYPQNGQHYGKHTGFVVASGALKESESWSIFPLPIEKKFLFADNDEEEHKFSFEIPNITPEEAWKNRGESLLKQMENEECKTLVERLRNVNSKIDNRKDSLIYSPVWIFNYSVDNIPYRNIVCGVRGKVIGEIPTNFAKLLEKLRGLKKDIDEKWNFLLGASIITIILFISMVGTVFSFFTLIAAGWLFVQYNKAKKEFEEHILKNKYNLCYYILRQRTDLKDTINSSVIPAIALVEKCIDDEEGARIDFNIAKQIVEKFLIATKPKDSNDNPAKKFENFVANTKNKVSEKLDAMKSSQTKPKKTCSCGKPVQEDWKVCPLCGNSLDA